MTLVPQLYREDGGPDGDPACGGGPGHGGEDWVRLTRLYQFARSVRGLLHTYHYNQIFLTEFPSAYCKFTGRSLLPRAYGYSGVDDLLGAIPQVGWPNTTRDVPITLFFPLPDS